MIKINKNSDTPLYQQIVESIQQDIKDSRLREGQQLLSPQEVSDIFGVSVIVAKQAYQKLHELGLVYTIASKGVFVITKHTYAIQFKDLLSLESVIKSYQFERIYQSKCAQSSGKQLVTFKWIIYDGLNPVIVVSMTTHMSAIECQESSVSEIMKHYQNILLTANGFNLRPTALSYAEAMLLNKKASDMAYILTIEDQKTKEKLDMLLDSDSFYWETNLHE